MGKAGKAGGELELIAMIRRASRAAKGKRAGGVVLGIGDDCAILSLGKGKSRSKSNEILVTTDFSLEGRHFRRDLHSAESVGHRCLARGLSDIAAMGGEPVAAFLSLALPVGMPGTREGKTWMAGFLRGMRALGDRYGVSLAGGDTAQSPVDVILADIVLVGMAPAGTAIRRSGGRPGDLLYCTGRLGGSAAELEAMMAGTFKGKARRAGDHPHLFPEPRLTVGALLRGRGLATACMDLSDGLSTDLAHLCEASGVGAEVEERLLPVHRLAGLRGGLHPTLRDKAAKDGAPGNSGRGVDLALHGGEDYELLFSASSKVKIPSKVVGVEITRIGRLVGGSVRKGKVELVRGDGSREDLVAGGWEHFTGKK